ncbi:MAG TPA: ATP-binding protein [Terriglobales bacterium]|nr:ATP-binding protein [Terriglobales bacterium]
MKRKDVDPELRARAEQRLRRRKPKTLPPVVPPEVLIHQLETHQIELEMQNDELRSARTQLEAALSRYSDLYEFAPIGYLILDPSGSIRELNLTAAEMLGGERSRIVGQRLHAFVSAADCGKLSTLLEAVFLTGEEGRERCELTLETARSVVHVQLTASVRSMPHASALVAIEDITLRVRSEAAQREVDRRKDEFLAVLSHELRNPMMPIQMSLYIATHAETPTDQLQQALAVIDRQVGHLKRLIDDLLDVSRIARGKIQLQLDRLDLNEVVQRTIADHRVLFDAAGVSLETRLEPRPCWVDGDPTRLGQVLGNLLANSAKFTPRGGRVQVSLSHAGAREIELKVCDSGAGMATEVLSHAFELFVQAPQSGDRPRGGLGLGLALVKNLVELHHGRVMLSSDGPSRGTVVTVRLPMAGSPPHKAVQQDRAIPARRVLVIEDNVDAAETLRQVLEVHGQQALVAFDGPTGLSRAREFLPDIVFCDIGLPGMDGYAVARAFRNDASLRRIQLIALSGYALPQDVQLAAEAGFDRHLAKPISFPELESVLSSPPASVG